MDFFDIFHVFHDAFQRFDADEDGAITLEELAAATKHLGVAESSLRLVVAEFDSDNNGVIDFTEFCELLTRHQAPGSAATAAIESVRGVAKQAGRRRQHEWKLSGAEGATREPDPLPSGKPTGLERCWWKRPIVAARA